MIKLSNKDISVREIPKNDPNYEYRWMMYMRSTAQLLQKRLMRSKKGGFQS